MSKSKIDYMVIDIEMTCEEKRVEGYKPEIIEIGLVIVSREGAVKHKEQIFVKPMYNKISEFCTNLTGYDELFLKKNGISYYDACRKIIKLGSKNKTIIAWGEDWNQFKMESEWKGVEYPLSNSNLNLSLINSIMLKSKEKVSLENALKFWDIEPVGRLHSGLDDAYNTSLILKKMTERFPSL